MKYPPTDATAEPLDRVLAAAFRRWAVERAFRLGKQEAGPMDCEGRSCTGLMRHLTPALIVPGFVATHTERFRGENPDATAGRACRALNRRCRAASRRRRGVPERPRAGDAIRYHQRRNKAAAKAHRKEPHRCALALLNPRAAWPV